MSLRVLVVDDDRQSASSAVIMLEEWGYQAIAAHDAMMALVLAATHGPQVVVFDGAVLGCQFARRLRALPGMSGALLIGVGVPRAADTGEILHLGSLKELARVLAEKAGALDADK